MGTDGATFAPKMGLIFTNWGQSLSGKVGFLKFLNQLYELTFLTKCWFFHTRNPPLSLFLAFLAAVL